MCLFPETTYVQACTEMVMPMTVSNESMFPPSGFSYEEKSEGCFAITSGARCRSRDFYNVYERWCQDNLEKPLAAKTFLHYLKEHQQALGIVYDEKCVGTSRGFHNVCLTPFVPVNDDDPDLPWH